MFHQCILVGIIMLMVRSVDMKKGIKNKTPI